MRYLFCDGLRGGRKFGEGRDRDGCCRRDRQRVRFHDRRKSAKSHRRRRSPRHNRPHHHQAHHRQAIWEAQYPPPSHESRIIRRRLARGRPHLFRCAGGTTNRSVHAGAEAGCLGPDCPGWGSVHCGTGEGTSYWQVTATQKGAAEGLVRSLRERQLPAILAESSKPELFRVLVGPYHTAPALAEAKRKLTDLGFNGLIPQKY